VIAIRDSFRKQSARARRFFAVRQKNLSENIAEYRSAVIASRVTDGRARMKNKHGW